MAKTKSVTEINDLALKAKTSAQCKEQLWNKFEFFIKHNTKILYYKFYQYIDLDYESFRNDIISESYIIFDRHLKRWDPSRFDFLGYWKFVYLFELNIVIRDRYLKIWKTNQKILKDFIDTIQFVQDNPDENSEEVDFDYSYEVKDLDLPIVLQDAIDKLSFLERRYVRYYFFKDLVQREIAEIESRRTGKTVAISFVCTVLKQAKLKLKDMLKEGFYYDAKCDSPEQSGRKIQTGRRLDHKVRNRETTSSKKN